MLICLGILFGSIFIYKAIGKIMSHLFFAANKAPIVTVSAMKASYSLWQPQLTASGSLRAVRGVNVTTELAGMVQKIYFTPGSFVQEGTVLVQLNADNEVALLNSLTANEQLAKINYQRDSAQYKAQAVSRAIVDTDAANLKSLSAQVQQQAAIVAKKTIRAPFTGRLGISAINPGQYINTGDTIVMLQSLDPIYLDFFIPQQNLSKLRTGISVTATTDTFPGRHFSGKITTINPAIDATTRNVEVEATMENPTLELVPGMFATVTVNVSKQKRFITLPQTAVSFNPYGEIIYLIKEKEKDKNGKPVFVTQQAFIITGETRGDQVAVLKGLNAGDTVVTSGQLKLKNGSLVEIDNSIQPTNNPTPAAPNEY